MKLQLLLLCIVIFLAPLLPPILSPLGFSLTGLLVAQKANPRILSLITVGISTITAIIIRKLQNHIIKKLTINEGVKGNNLLARIINTMNRQYKNNQKIARVSLKRERYIETKTGKLATFFFAIFCFLPIIADIISIRILYKKIKFPYFILAVIIGKSLSHIPFIFVGKTIVQILGIHM